MPPRFQPTVHTFLGGSVAMSAREAEKTKQLCPPLLGQSGHVFRFRSPRPGASWGLPHCGEVGVSGFAARCSTQHGVIVCAFGSPSGVHISACDRRQCHAMSDCNRGAAFNTHGVNIWCQHGVNIWCQHGVNIWCQHGVNMLSPPCWRRGHGVTLGAHGVNAVSTWFQHGVIKCQHGVTGC
jgi:hypothetical protein